MDASATASPPPFTTPFTQSSFHLTNGFTLDTTFRFLAGRRTYSYDVAGRPG